MLRLCVLCVVSVFGLSLMASGAPPEPITSLEPITSPEDLQRGYAILETVRRESKGKNYSMRDYLSTELAAYDPDLALKLASGDGPTSDMELSFIIARLAQHDPARAAKWAAPRLRQMQDVTSRLTATSSMGPQLAVFAPDLAAEILKQAETRLKPAPVTGDEIFLYVYAGMLAASLKRPNVIWFQTALDTAQKLVEKDKTGDQVRGLREAIVEGIAASNPEVAEKAALSLPVGTRVAALSRAVAVIAPKEVKTAQRLLELIKAEPAPPEPVPDERGIARRSLNENPEWAFGLAAKAVIAELGKTEPGAALSLARQVNSPRHRADALALAARFQEKEVALALYREAAQAVLADEATFYRNVSTIARYAAQAYSLDPETGEELFARARRLMEERRIGDAGVNVEDSTAFAFYRARIAPQQSRALLEAEFTRLNAVRTDAQSGVRLSQVARAMSAIDVERALQIARTIPDDFWRFDTQRKIAQYVVAPEAVRRDIPFERWGATDNWQPGTPTDW
jgi:hypothetical protein